MFNKVRRNIKGTGHKSRSEAFLEWAEEDPGEIYAMQAQEAAHPQATAVRKRLGGAILAEHVIEHVPFLQVLGFFQECLRVLKPGGMLRIAFPDIGRFLTSRSCDFALNEDAHSYARGLSRRIELPGSPLDKTRAALWQLLAGWGHQTAWTERSAAGALLVVGFSRVCRREYGQGEFRCVDGHHRDVGPELALLESTILEAQK